VSQATEDQPRVVVGVDGSDPSLSALRWAVRHARLTGSHVEAVTAWQYPVLYTWEPEGIDADFETTARAMLAKAVAGARAQEPDVGVRAQVAEGHPAEVLVRAADGADLLVLGCRGRGTFPTALVGSVSLHCVLRAPCPVLVHRAHPASS
jgi:nucleotide-binding universal stress UspA family protein